MKKSFVPFCSPSVAKQKRLQMKTENTPDQSCYDVSDLKLIVEELKKKPSLAGQLADINPGKQGEGGSGNNELAHYWKQVQKVFEEACGMNEACWLDQKPLQDVAYKLTEKFVPKGPVGHEWLSNFDIQEVMDQYEQIYEDFLYIGTYPRDILSSRFRPLSLFEPFASRRWGGAKTKSLNEKGALPFYYDKGIRKIATVFNLDCASGGGFHWTSLFIDMSKLKSTGKATVEYFDSVGDHGVVGQRGPRLDPPVHNNKKFKEHRGGYGSCSRVEIPQFLELLKEELVSMGAKDAQVVRNDYAHQKGDTECGVYALYFITQRLKGVPFDEFIINEMTDSDMNRLRKFFFRMGGKKLKKKKGKKRKSKKSK